MDETPSSASESEPLDESSSGASRPPESVEKHAMPELESSMAVDGGPMVTHQYKQAGGTAKSKENMDKTVEEKKERKTRNKLRRIQKRKGEDVLSGKGGVSI